MALLSYFLIRFSNTHESINSAKTSLLTNSISGVFLLVCFIILKKNGAHSLSDIQNISISQNIDLICINLFFLIAIIIKSAQFPFHFWILKAMKAPAPVSALLHSCTIVKAGLYLFIQLVVSNENIFSMALNWIKYISIITILYTFLKTFFCRQIKQILALTTISNIALMYYFIPELVISTKSLNFTNLETSQLNAININITELLIFFYVANHAVYKAIMFLVAGLLEKRHQLTVINKIKDVKQSYCTITITMICFLTALGMPFCLGKIAKNILHLVEIPMPIYMIFSINSAVILHLLHLMIRSRFRKFSSRITKNKKIEKLLLLFSITTIIAIPIYIIHNDLILTESIIQNLTQNITSSVTRRINNTITDTTIHKILRNIDVFRNTMSKIFQQHMHFIDHAFTIFTMFFAYMLTINLIPFNHIQQPILLYRFRNKMHNIKGNIHSILSSTKYNLSKLTHIFKISFLVVVIYMLIQTDWNNLLNYMNESFSHLVNFTTRTFENAFLETYLMTINLLITIIGITFIQTNIPLMQIIGSSIIGISVGMIYISLGAPDVAITHFLSETVAMLFLYSICKDNHFTNNLINHSSNNFNNNVTDNLANTIKTTITNTIHQKKSFFRQNILLKSTLIGVGISIFIFLLHICQTDLNNVATENYIHLSSHGRNIVNLIVTDYRGFDTFGEMTAICISGFIIYASKMQKTQNSQSLSLSMCDASSIHNSPNASSGNISTNQSISRINCNDERDDKNNHEGSNCSGGDSSNNNNNNNNSKKANRNFSQLIFSEHFMQSAKSLHLIIPFVSIIMITQGHNIPGGGFIVGLMMSLYFYAVNIKIKFNLIILGIIVAILSSVIPLFLDYSFFTNMVDFQKYGLPIEHFSFAMIFDISIMLAVIGMINIGRSNL